MDNENENLELDEYLKKVKEADKYKEREINSNRYNGDNNELDDYLRKLEESKKSKSNIKKSKNRDSHDIVYDFTKTLNYTIKDIDTSLNKSENMLLEGTKYSKYNSSKIMQEKSLNVNEANIDKKINNRNIDQQIKYSSSTSYIKKELNRAKNIDKELYKNLEAIERITNREMEYLNSNYKEYKDLIYSKQSQIKLTYEQMMSNIKIYGESKRSIEADQAEMIRVVKGETKNQQLVKITEKSMNYLKSAENRVHNLKSENKIFDFRGNRERNKIIKDIRKEIEIQKKILKDNGINSKEDFERLKNEVSRQENYIKSMLEAENARYKEEIKERGREDKSEKQIELQKIENRKHEDLKDKKMQLER